MVKKEPGWWICRDFGSHEFMEDPSDLGLVQIKAAGGKDSANGAQGQYWLSHLGIKEALPPVRQASNGLDGVMCQAVGEIKAGGGGSSGRKRKKPMKPEPWYRQQFQ